MWNLRLSKLACSILLFYAATKIASSEKVSLTTLYSFCSETNCADGSTPYAGLVQASDGSFLGTTYLGGANNGGTVFKINAEGKLTTLYSFCSQTGCTDGNSPYASLLHANGDFYGTTETGGAEGDGTVFEIGTAGALTVLHSFDGSDGFNPYAGLIQAADRNFYGTTGGGESGPNVSGTVFKITSKGKLITLYSFCSQPNCTDGANPWGVLVQATDGNFYGTTGAGGTHVCKKRGEQKIGCGTVFKITPKGKLTTLYNFCSHGGSNCTDGSEPLAGLVGGSDGSFYGTTSGGGANADGTIFKITAKGKLTTLHSFDGADGAIPYAGLLPASDGNLYGTTKFGGANNRGVVFKVTAVGKLTTLYSFCSQTNCADGYFPQATPLQATNGRFYGTTSAGGNAESGTVFRLSVGLGPEVEFKPLEPIRTF